MVADGSLSTPAADNCSTFQKQITSELDKYLQEATEKCERYSNYYDAWHMATNTSSPQQEANFLEEDHNIGSEEEDNNKIVPEEEDNNEIVLESYGQDTGVNYATPQDYNSQPQDKLETIPEEEEPQTEEKQDLANQDTIVFTTDESKEEPFNTAIDDTSDDPTIVMGKPVMIAFISDDVRIPTEKVGCLQLLASSKNF